MTRNAAEAPILDAIRRIERNALSVDEVLASHGADRHGASTSESGEKHAAEALRLWCHAFSRGNQEAFDRRLAWDGLTEEDVRCAVESRLHGHRSGEGPLAPWAQSLIAVLALFDHGNPPPVANDAPISGGVRPPIPFLEAWLPFLAYARTEVRSLAGEHLSTLDSAAVTDLENHLLRQLSEVGAPALIARFDHFRATAQPRGRPGTEPRSPGREIYVAFVERLLAGEMLEVLDRYPMLARQLSRLTRTWATGTAELAQRLAADHDEIAETFNDGASTGPVTHVHPGMSDRHHGGRQVAALEFRCGLRLVYKPRDLTMEAAYNAFLHWLAAEGLDPCPPPLAVLPRPGYGWVELAQQQAARTSVEVRTYYRRAGALLFTAWVLGGRDLHMENVIATRQGPVLVDVEALIQPPQTDSAVAGSEDLGGQADSFLATGLLSFPQVGVDGGVCDVGGLCGTGGRPASARQRDWVDVNTDSMRMVAGAGTTPDAENLLFLDGKAELPEGHVAELAAGFVLAYRFLIERREQLLDASGPLAPFATARTRIVLRPSNLYARVLLELTSPKLQRSGLTASFAIDSLNHVFRNERERPRLWPLAAEERQALFALDVPLFTVPVSSAVLVSRNGEPIHDHLVDSGLGAIHTRLQALEETHLGSQLQLLRQALQTAPGTPTRDRERRRGTADSDQLLIAAEGIAQRLQEAPGEDEEASCDLYDGCAGVTVFFAALASVTGYKAWRELADKTARPIARALDDGDLQRLAPGGSVGICSGLGGVVYACGLSSRLLNDARFGEMARAAAGLLTDDLIAADNVFDVEGGAAGALLALLSAADELRGTGWLERAESCARHLLAAARTAPGGGCGWPTNDGLMLAGFAHGAAGIAYALARLFVMTADPDLRDAVLKAQTYERTLYSAADRNWPVLNVAAPGRPPERLVMTAWCHGAPGIALARLGTLGAVPDPAARNDLEVALDTTVRTPFSGPDHLCCGNLGRVDVILKSGRSLGRADLVAQAWERATAVVRRAVAVGAFGVPHRDQHSDSIPSGLFQGVSGIGYQLLRLTSPDLLPSVLAFDGSPDAVREGSSP